MVDIITGDVDRSSAAEGLTLRLAQQIVSRRFTCSRDFALSFMRSCAVLRRKSPFDVAHNVLAGAE